MDTPNKTPEIRNRRISCKTVLALMAVVCVVMAALLVLQTMRLQREQERVAVAEATISRAQELLDLADDDLEHYCATVREYYAEKNHPIFTEIEPQDYSEIFSTYTEWHPIPNALLGA